jgi:hypothetical protein
MAGQCGRTVETAGPPSTPVEAAVQRCVAPQCGQPAVTRDGRSLCLEHLREAIRQETPMTGCYRGRRRTADHRQERECEPSPWRENAVRALEDG